MKDYWCTALVIVMPRYYQHIINVCPTRPIFYNGVLSQSCMIVNHNTTKLYLLE